jgi:hypothetical protein
MVRQAIFDATQRAAERVIEGPLRRCSGRRE